MQKILLILAIIITSVYSQAQNIKAQSAIEYNNFFVDSQQILTDGVYKLNKDIELFGTDSIEVNIHYLQLSTKQILADTRRMEIYLGGERLKAAFVALFEYYDKALGNEFPELFSIYAKEEPTDSDNVRADKLLNDLTSTEDKLEKECRSAQDAFAAANNFEIEDIDEE
jgi:hypothetical protein